MEALMGNNLAQQAEKRRLLTLDPTEFDNEMRSLDEILRSKNIPIVARPIQALSHLCQKYHFAMGLGEPLWIRMDTWFKERYGSRLNVDLSYGKVPVLLFGDAYPLKLPVLFYGGYLVASTKPVLEKMDRPVINVVDWVEGMPEGMADRLANQDLSMLLDAFRRFSDVLCRIDQVRNENGFKNARGNIEAATHLITTANYQVGLSRWESLQATEKFLKAYIAQSGEQFKFSHDLKHLHEHAANLGLTGVKEEWITQIQCAAEVRYAPLEGSLGDAVHSVYSSLEVCAKVADAAVSRRKPN